jgi:hypothetical protein
MTRRAPPLAEPIEVAKWWLTRGGVAGRLRLASYDGRHFVELERLATKAGFLVPTATWRAEVKHLTKLQRAIDKAIRRARELGLLAPEG